MEELVVKLSTEGYHGLPLVVCLVVHQSLVKKPGELSVDLKGLEGEPMLQQPDLPCPVRGESTLRQHDESEASTVALYERG